MNETQPPEWAARAAEEVEAALGARVRENTGLQFGFFAGISVNDLAAIIMRHLPNAATHTPKANEKPLK